MSLAGFWELLIMVWLTRDPSRYGSGTGPPPHRIGNIGPTDPRPPTPRPGPRHGYRYTPHPYTTGKLLERNNFSTMVSSRFDIDNNIGHIYMYS